MAALILIALLFLWKSHSPIEAQIQGAQEWTQDPEDASVQESAFNEPKRLTHTHSHTDGHINGLLPYPEADVMCAAHAMKPYPIRDRRRKVYDLFLVGTELSWAEIRLNELASEVDYFVILESDKSFTNKTKPTYFKNNWEHFSKFSSQIIYHLLDDSSILQNTTWEREHYSRDALLHQIFPSLIGEQAPNLGDVIMVSDIDEIPKPETVAKLRNCDIPQRVGMEAKFSLYSFNIHNVDEPWTHPQATTWQGDKNILPGRLRWDPTDYNFKNAAWHCTSCFSTVDEFINKIKSFGHQEYNQPSFTDPDAIVRRVRDAADLFDRGTHYERIAPEDLDVPSYLLRNSDRFAYLLDRSPENANFRDYVPPSGGDVSQGDVS